MRLVEIRGDSSDRGVLCTHVLYAHARFVMANAVLTPSCRDGQCYALTMISAAPRLISPPPIVQAP